MEELFGHSFSASTVSNVVKRLDAQLGVVCGMEVD